jgi:hypothetical protein
VKSTSKLIKVFGLLLVAGLAIALIVPLATRSSRADQQTFALSAGDQLTITCPTKLEGMRHGKDVMLVCKPAEGQDQGGAGDQHGGAGDQPGAPSGDPAAPADGQAAPADNQAQPADQSEPPEPAVDTASPDAAGPQAEQQALLAVQAAAAPPAPATGPNPFGCAPGQIAADAQGWWMPMGSQKGNDFGHLHTTVCFPHMATLSGKVNFKIRSVLHNNPGQFKRLMVQIFGPNHAKPGCNDDYAIVCQEFKPTRTIKNCAATGGSLTDNGATCVWWDTLAVDTSLFDNDGIQEFRFRGFVAEPDGNDMRTSTGLHAYLKTGHPVKNYTSANFMEARGWYPSVNYSVARLNNPPTGPVSGVWKPSVELKPGSGGKPITSWYATLDGDFHKGNPGNPICPGGAAKGDPLAPICGTGAYKGTLTIDTTKLANGWHRLFLKADAASSTLGSTNSGVLAILFEVKN